MLNWFLTIPTTDTDLQRRGRTVLSVALVLLALIGMDFVILSFRPDPIPSLLGLVVGSVVVIAAIVLAHRGFVSVSAWMVVSMTILATAVPSMIRHEVTSSLVYLMLPMVVAGVLLRPWQVWIVLAIGMSLLGYKAYIKAPAPLPQFEGWVLLFNSGFVMVTLTVVSFMSARIIAHAFAEVAAKNQLAEVATTQLVMLNRSLEGEIRHRTHELQVALSQAQTQAQERQVLLDELAKQQEVIHEMSVPVLPVGNQTLVMPLMGALDSRRLMLIQTQALSALERSRAKTLLIDLTAVPLVDTQVAQGLIHTVQASQLLGAVTVLIGIRPEVAQAIVGLGIDLSEVAIASDLASALKRR